MEILMLLWPWPETGVIVDAIEHAAEGFVGNCLIESLMGMQQVWSG